LQPALEDQLTPILRPLREHACPASVLPQLCLQFREGGTGHCCREKFILTPAKRFLTRIAIQLLAAAIPFDDASIEFPDENRIT
jgi:hypothetical protein